jgi:Lrp/AsnC family transcriptional regulator for asnA, asnC and gidA
MHAAAGGHLGAVDPAARDLHDVHAIGPQEDGLRITAVTDVQNERFHGFGCLERRIPCTIVVMVDPNAQPSIGAVSLRINHSRPGAAFQLDELSKAIIEKLQQDGRRSYAGIGKAVGLSEAAVRQRVQRMVDAGVMQIVAVTDPMQLGFARQAMIGIRCTGDTTKIADKLANIESVDYVVLTAGSFDAIVEVVCEDDGDLLDLLNTKIRAVPGVISTETLVYLKLVKQQYNWGTR